ncbi:BrnT family toxin [Mesorhizobium sp. B2-1-1]|uniref:BrnT family toxin n=2 Tax=Mesorhizobium TaxID=68287 RepID=UPI0039AF5A6D
MNVLPEIAGALAGRAKVYPAAPVTIPSGLSAFPLWVCRAPKTLDISRVKRDLRSIRKSRMIVAHDAGQVRLCQGCGEPRKAQVTASLWRSAFEDDNHLIIPSIREIDGEERFKVVGIVGEKLFTGVFVWRGEQPRFISVRRSNKGEERAYLATC